MAYKIEEIEGIGSRYGARLVQAGVTTTGELLRRCGTAAGRKALAQRVGLGESRLRRWANMADLMRVHGVGRQYAELLVAAGVSTVRELRARDPGDLSERMRDVNESGNLVKVPPTANVVSNWILRASKLSLMIDH